MPERAQGWVVRFPGRSVSSTYPGKRSFFKYLAPETALSVLKSRTVRYSSPLTFNDPFDVQSGLHFDFDIDVLQEKTLDRLEKLAAAPEEPSVDKDDPWGTVVLRARELYPTHGFPRDRWEQMTVPVFAWLVRLIKTEQEKYQEHWWKNLLPGIRVFCVSEERDSLLMWAHYARDHTGAVFEFLSLPDADNALSVAEPVIYVEQPPPLLTEVELIDDVLSGRKFNKDDLGKGYVYMKSKHWQYEREWRVWYHAPAPGILYEDFPIWPPELASVYIGCRADRAFAGEVVSLTRNAFPGTRIYQARKSETAYTLEYTEI